MGSAFTRSIIETPVTHESGGLEADVSAYDGLLRVSGGTTSAVTIPGGGLVGITEAQALTNKTIDTATNTFVLDTGDVTTGTFANARIAQSNITQYESALTITESQISDLQSYALSSHNHTLDSLSNTTITTIAAGELLQWNGTAWINQTKAELDLASAATLSSHTANTSNPHSVTAAQLSLGAADSPTFAGLTLTGNQTITGHILPSATDTYDLGSPTMQWRDIYVSAGSLYVDGTQVIQSDASTIIMSTDADQDFKILETGSDDIILQVDTGNIELKGTVEILTGKKVVDSAATLIEFGNAIDVDGVVTATSFTGDGSALTALNTANITNLTTAIDNRIDAAQTVAGAWTFSSTVGIVGAASFDGGIRLQQEASTLVGAAGYSTLWADQSAALKYKDEGGAVYTVATTAAVWATSSITSGTFADARIAESNVTQHEAALSITESQISDLGTHTHTASGITDFNTAVDARLDTTQSISGQWTFANNLYVNLALRLKHDTSDQYSGTVGSTTFYAFTGDNLRFRDGTGTIYQIASRAWVDAHVWDTSDITTGTFADARIAASNVTQHQAALSVTASQVSDFSTAADARITAQKAAANGLATLGADSKIPTAQLPALALTERFIVADQTAQLAADAQQGDLAIRTDENKTYVHNGGVAGTMADWSELLTPTDNVTSVNGNSGVVVLDTGDIAEGSNLYYTDARVDTRLDAAQTITNAWTFSAGLTAGNTLYLSSAGRATWGTLNSENAVYIRADQATRGAYLVSGNDSAQFVGITQAGVTVTSGALAAAGTITQGGVAVSLSTHTHALDDLSDASVAAPSTDQVLSWSGSAWVATDLSTIPAGNAATLDSLDSTQFLRSDAADTFTQILSGSGNGFIQIERDGAATDNAFRAKLDTFGTYSFAIDVSGKHEWGDGTAAFDTNLYRSAANVLKTDDAFHAASLALSGALTGATTGTFSSLVTAAQLLATGGTSGQLQVVGAGTNPTAWWVQVRDGGELQIRNSTDSANVVQIDHTAPDLSLQIRTTDLVFGGDLNLNSNDITNGVAATFSGAVSTGALTSSTGAFSGAITQTVNGISSSPLVIFQATNTNDYGIVEIKSGHDNNYRPALLRFYEASSLKWTVGGVYQAAVAGSFGISTDAINSVVPPFLMTPAGDISMSGAVSTGALTVGGTLGVSGTATFTTPLSDTNAIVVERTGGAVSSFWAYNDTSTAIDFGTSTAHELRLFTNNANRYEIDSSGNHDFKSGTADFLGDVSIGTATKNGALTVNGDRTYLQRNSDGAVSEVLAVRNSGTTSGTLARISMLGSDGIPYANFDAGRSASSNAHGRLLVYTRNTSVATLAAEFDENQNFTSYGSITASGGIVVANDNNINIGTTSGNTGRLQIYDSGGTAYTLGLFSSGTRTWKFEGSSSGSDHAMILENPGAGEFNLTVNGDATITGHAAFGTAGVTEIGTVQAMGGAGASYYILSSTATAYHHAYIGYSGGDGRLGISNSNGSVSELNALTWDETKAVTAHGTLGVTGVTTTAGLDSSTNIGITNGSPTTGYGLSLYGTAVANPTYGIMFAGTATYGTHGGVTSDWATYFNMNNSAARGWIWRNHGTGAGVASLAVDGEFTVPQVTVTGTLGVTGVATVSRLAVTGATAVEEVGLSVYASGAWLNSPTGTNGWLGTGGTGVLKWSAAAVDITGTLTATGNTTITGTTYLALVVGDGTADRRITAHSSNQFGFRAVNGVGNGAIYFGASAEAVPDGIWSDHSGTEIMRISDGGNLSMIGTLATTGVGYFNNGNSTYGLTTGLSLELGQDGTPGAIKLWGDVIGDPGYIQMTTSNMHIDVAGAGGSIYLNWYGGQGDVFFGNGASATAIKIDGSADKILFGNAQDTNLYRSAANTLKTDDSFVIGGTTLIIPATALLMFDGGSNTYIHENSADNLQVVAAGTARVDINSAGLTATGLTSTGTLDVTGETTLGIATFSASTRLLKWKHTSGQANSRSWGFIGEQGSYGKFELRRSAAASDTPDTTVLWWDLNGSMTATGDVYLTAYQDLHVPYGSQVRFNTAGGSDYSYTYTEAGTDSLAFKRAGGAGLLSFNLDTLATTVSGPLITAGAATIGTTLDVTGQAHFTSASSTLLDGGYTVPQSVKGYYDNSAHYIWRNGSGVLEMVSANTSKISTAGHTVDTTLAVTSDLTVTGNTAMAGRLHLSSTTFNTQMYGTRLKEHYWHGLGAVSAQARRHEIARLGADTANWQNTGITEIEIWSRSYASGYKKYRLMNSYTAPNQDIQLVDQYGNDSAEYRILTEWTVVSGNVGYLRVYLEVDYYHVVDVKLTHNYSTTTYTDDTPAQNVAFIDPTPTGSDVASFAASETLRLGGAAGYAMSGVADLLVGGTLKVTGDLKPTTNATYDIGADDMEWADIWYSGKLYCINTSNYRDYKTWMINTASEVYLQNNGAGGVTLTTPGGGDITLTPAGGAGTLKLSGDVKHTAANVSHYFVESDASADNSTWSINVNAEQFLLKVSNDALSAGANFMTVQRTGNTVDSIEFGTTALTVTGTLGVTGATTLTGHVGIALSTGTAKALNVQTTYATGQPGDMTFYEYTASGPSSSTHSAGRFSNYTIANADDHTGKLLGLNNRARHFGTGTVNEMVGGAFLNQNDSSGTITTGRGGQFGSLNNSTGTMVNQMAGWFYVRNLGAGLVTDGRILNVELTANAGTYTQLYGLYMGATSTGTHTNTPYNIYLSDTASLNHLGGNTTVDGTLDVTGAVTLNDHRLYVGEDGTSTNPHLKLYDGTNIAYLQISSGDLHLNHGGSNRLSINTSGVITAPADAGLSYVAGNNLVYTDDAVYSVLDTATNADYWLMKTWRVDRSGSVRVKWAGYIQSGPNYFAWKLAKNGEATTLDTGYFSTDLDTGEVAAVHGYRRFSVDVTGLEPGDTLELYMVSSSGGGVPLVGSGTQTLYCKEFRVYSAAPAYGMVYEGAEPDFGPTIFESSDSGSGPHLTLRRSRGSDIGDQAGTPIQSGNWMGSINFQALDAAFANDTLASYAPYETSAKIAVQANQTHTDTAHGTKMLFQTTPDGSTTLTTALTLADDQTATFAAGITAYGAVVANSTLTVTGAATFNGNAHIVGATPTLYLTDTNEQDYTLRAAGNNFYINNVQNSLDAYQINAGGTHIFRHAAEGIMLQMGATDIQLDHSGGVDVATGDFKVSAGDITVSAGALNVEGQGRFKAWYTAGTGKAVEVGVSSNEGYVIAYDRTGSSYIKMYLQGSSIESVCNFNPYADSAYDLGTTSKRWRALYADTIELGSGAGKIVSDWDGPNDNTVWEKVYDANYYARIKHFGNSRLLTITSGGVGGNISQITFNGETAKATITGALDVTGALTLPGSGNHWITTNTSDGADNAGLFLDAGAGAATSTRGAYVGVFGNESSVHPGKVLILAGNVAGGDIEFHESGVQAMTISGGNVGIGTTSPFQYGLAGEGIQIGDRANVFKLDVTDSLYLTCNLTYDGVTGWEYEQTSGGTIVEVSDVNGGSFDIYGVVSGTGGTAASLVHRFRVDEAGNVGVGTSTPFSRGLQGEGIQIGTQGAIFELDVNDVFYLGNNLSYDGTNWEYLETGGGSMLTMNDASGGGLYFYGVASGTGGTAAALLTRFIIDSAGYVGIGTASPEALLHIEGPNGDATGNDYSQLILRGTGTYPDDIAGITLDSVGSNQSHIRFQNNGVSKFQIRYNEGNSTVDKLQFYSWTQAADMVTFDGATGRVGIGETSPAQKLQIGSVGASGYGGNDFAIGDGTTVYAVYISGGDTNFYTNGDYNFLWSGGTGNVGIGAASTGAKLFVSGSGQFTSTLTAGAATVSSVTVAAPSQYQFGLKLPRSGTDYHNLITWSQGSGTQDWSMGHKKNTYDWVLWAANGATPTATAPGTERIKITNAGAFTLTGTVNVTSTLDVGGTLDVAGASIYLGANNLALTTSGWGFQMPQFSVTGVSAFGSGVDGAVRVKVYTGGTATAGLNIHGVASQSADLLGVLSSAGAKHLAVSGAGNVVVGNAAISTAATDGFLYIPTCAGTPTGTPTTNTGRVPLVFDSTNDILYVYAGGSWIAAGGGAASVG